MSYHAGRLNLLKIQMKTQYLFIFIWLLTGLSSQGFAKETIRISTGEWAPYISENLVHYGLVSRIITEAFALKGIEVKYEFFPWGRAMHLAKYGDFDASSVWYYHNDRNEFFYHSDPVMENTEVFFHLKSFKFDWDKWNDLKGLMIGSTIGYTVTKLLKEKQKEGKYILEVVSTDELNFRKMLRERIQIFPLDKDVAFELLNRKFTKKEIQRLTYHPKAVNSGDLYLLFSKKVPRNKRLLELFNQGLKELKANGKYHKFCEESIRGDYIKK